MLTLSKNEILKGFECIFLHLLSFLLNGTGNSSKGGRISAFIANRPLSASESLFQRLKLTSRTVIVEIFFILQISHRLWREETYCTERDLYYMNSSLFSFSQRRLSYAIGVLSLLLTNFWRDQFDNHHIWCRDDLRIIAARKSLIGGKLFYDTDTQKLQQNIHYSSQEDERSPNLLSYVVASNAYNFRSAFLSTSSPPTCVIIVEKESTWHQLIFSDHLPSRLGCGVVCGRGYPCIALRTFLVRFNLEHPSVPLIVLADSDPHGIAIVFTYAGLLGQSCKSDLSMPQSEAILPILPVEWGGLRPSRWEFHRIRRGSLKPVLPITSNDYKLLKHLRLKLSKIPPTNTFSRWVHDWENELLQIESCRFKCEIQAAVGGAYSVLKDYIDTVRKDKPNQYLGSLTLSSNYN